MAVVQQGKLSSDDLNHRLRQDLNRKVKIIADSKKTVEKLKKEMAPIKKKLDEAAAKETEAREAIKDIFFTHKITNARFILEKGVLDTIAPSLSVEVVDEDKIPAPYAEEITTVKVDKNLILKAWKEYEGKAEEFYAEVPGIVIMEGSVSVKVTI